MEYLYICCVRNKLNALDCYEFSAGLPSVHYQVNTLCLTDIIDT